MHTKLGFALNPVPSYLPNMHELEYTDVGNIKDTAFTEVRCVEKIEQATWSGNANAKIINAIECKIFCNFFKIPELLYDASFTQVISELTPKILGNDTD